MRKHYVWALSVLCWLTAAQCFAGSGALIVGPDKVLPGDLVVLRASELLGSGVVWEVVPEAYEGRWFVADGGQTWVFASRTPGRVYVIAAGLRDGKVVMARHVLVNGGDAPEPEPEPPDPEPPDPDPPDPSPEPTGWAKWAKLTAEKLVSSPQRRAEAQSLAGALESTCGAIAAGTMKTPRQAREALRQASHRALAASADRWEGFSRALDGELDKLATAGKLKSLADYREVWSAIATGLQEVR